MALHAFVTILVGSTNSGKNEYGQTREQKLNNDSSRGNILLVDYTNLQAKGFSHFNKTTLQTKLGNLKELDKQYEEVIVNGEFLNIKYLTALVSKYQELGFKNFKFACFGKNVPIRDLEKLKFAIEFPGKPEDYREVDEEDTTSQSVSGDTGVAVGA